MAHFAILCPENAGHVLSVGPIGCELIRRGHRATLIARDMAAPLAKQLDLPLHVWNWDDVPERPSRVLWPLFYVLGMGWKIGLRDRFCRRAEVVLRKLPDVVRELAVDGLVVDQTMSAAGTAAQRAGVPFVTVCSATPWNEEPDLPPPFTDWPYDPGPRARRRNRAAYAGWHWFMRKELATVNRYRKAWGFPPLAEIDAMYSPLAQISQGCAEYDFPRHAAPPHFHYVGSLAANRRVQSDAPFPWDRLNDKPLIFASLGSDPHPGDLPVLRNILAACAPLDVQVALALGRWQEKQKSVRDKLGAIPENAIVVDFAPQLALLDKAALLITHAGINTVLEALCRGVPMVAVPRNVDQPGTAARIVYSGVGLMAPPGCRTAEHLRGLICRVLTEDNFRRRAQVLQQSLSAAGGAARAAEIAEQAILSRCPVLRP